MPSAIIPVLITNPIWGLVAGSPCSSAAPGPADTGADVKR